MESREKWIDRWYRKSQSQDTKNSVQSFLKTWDKFLLQANRTEESLNKDNIFTVLQDYINWGQDRGNSATTIRQYFMFLKDWLWFNAIKIYDEDVKHELTFPKKVEGEKAPMTREIINTLVEKTKSKKSLYLVLASSGMRIGETLQLRMKDVRIDESPARIIIPPPITKAKRGRTTFISSEAVESLRDFRRWGKESKNFIFWSGEDFQRARANEIHYFREILLKCGLLEKSWNNYNNTLSLHSFRSFFITRVARHDENYSKKWAGQKGYLLQYDRMPIEEQAEIYRKIEPDLTISSNLVNNILK